MCLENRNEAGRKGKRRMAAFCLWQEGRICYYGSVCMDDEKPLKRADLRKRAEEKAAELAAEGMELHPVTASGRNLAKSSGERNG